MSYTEKEARIGHRVRNLMGEGFTMVQAFAIVAQEFNTVIILQIESDK